MHHSLQSACMHADAAPGAKGERIPRPIYSPSGALISRRRQWQHDNGISWIRWWHGGSKRRPAHRPAGGGYYPPMPAAAAAGGSSSAGARQKGPPRAVHACSRTRVALHARASGRAAAAFPFSSSLAGGGPDSGELLPLPAGLTLIDRSKTRKKGKFLQ